MKTQRNILIAFLLNLFFSIFEFIGGTITGSVAITSDAVHDLGDAMSIGLTYFLEKKSKQKPDDIYTYGYARYSVLGSLITTLILIIGSIFVIYHAVERIFNPEPIDYNGMIVIAIFGFIVNAIATYVTKEGDSLNQKAVNLHMLEDVLGWAIVLIGAVVMKFTDFILLDSILSIGLGLFILKNALANLIRVIDLFLEKSPDSVKVSEIRKVVTAIDGVENVHHIHLWSLDGYNSYITMHVVTDRDHHHIKEEVRDSLYKLGINHTTLELEGLDEECSNEPCVPETIPSHSHHHHHHH